ncbi:hypothetical protein Q4519_17595 [Motilimonas sp. 1_MG-2023]|uniref:hypothetical protein n=1 Tax=Motilimonas sp. 1_MG-2023 TaxID=3062672 RepID=UPI0026E3E5AE|nr:hypothetical protein [Motilimonas sp. 1_MG-2023]MDO6527497.1 hypothetical protein [Motilimonas sp. 1_MG-2023]
MKEVMGRVTNCVQMVRDFGGGQSSYFDVKQQTYVNQSGVRAFKYINDNFSLTLTEQLKASHAS